MNCAPPAAASIREISTPRFVHKDGRIVTLSWIGAWSEPVRRYFFIGRDTTESRQAQETLLESEQLARGIIDTALDAFIQMTEDGVISDWNPQAETIFGWSRSEAIGRRLDELIIPELLRDAHQSGPAALPAHRSPQDPRAPARNRCAAARRQGDQGRTLDHRA